MQGRFFADRRVEPTTPAKNENEDEHVLGNGVDSGRKRLDDFVQWSMDEGEARARAFLYPNFYIDLHRWMKGTTIDVRTYIVTTIGLPFWRRKQIVGVYVFMDTLHGVRGVGYVLGPFPPQIIRLG